jgi:hypothetical protein
VKKLMTKIITFGAEELLAFTIIFDFTGIMK